MPSFRYQALNADQRLVSGEVRAETVGQAISQLEADGLTVQSIGYASSASAPSEPVRAKAADVPPKTEPLSTGVEQAVLHAHMQKVLEQGKPLVPALRAYADEMPSSGRRRQLQTVCRILDQGDAKEATAALSALPEYWIALLSSAASSNDPGRVLREFLEESQRTGELRRQWWLTLAYPVIVVGVAVAVLTLFSFLVIPAFRDVFDDFQLALHGLTRLILAVSLWITSGGAIVVPGVLFVLAVFLLNAHRLLPQSVAAWLGDCFGAVFGRSTSIAQFARFTADLLDAGIDIPNALRIAGFTIRRSRLRKAGWRLANDIEAGRGGQQSAQRVLTATLLHAVQSDMPTSSRIRLLKEISCCHADRARNRLSWTQGVIEPVTICVVGVIVGVVVIALFLPLISLVDALSG